MKSERLTRASEGRLVAGVCSGIARRAGVDPLVIRIAFALLVFATWSGLFMYIAAALMMGHENGEPSIAERAFQRRFDAAAVVGLMVVLFLCGLLGSFAGSGMLGAPGRDTITTLTILGLAILVAQARGVDLVEAAKTLPDRLKGEPLRPEPVAVSAAESPQLVKQQWIDLATLRPMEVVAPLREPMAPYQPPAPPAPRPPRPKRSKLGQITVLFACMAAAAMVPVTSGDGAVRSVQLISAAALAVVALGLVIGTWFGRPHGLVTIGALLSITLLTSAAVGEVPAGSRFGDVHWRPTNPHPTQPYRLALGDGTLDLRALPLEAGQSYQVNAELGVGGLRVILPSNVKVRVKASVLLGDITIDKKIISGPRARYDDLIPGLTAEDAPTIELTVKGRFGDLELTHAA